MKTPSLTSRHLASALVSALLLVSFAGHAAAEIPDGLEIRKKPDESRRVEVQRGSTVCPSLCLARLDFGNRQDYYFVDAEGATRYLISERRADNADVRVNPPILDYQPTTKSSAAIDCGGDGWGYHYGDSVVTLALTGFKINLMYAESGVGRVLVMTPDGQPLRTSPAAVGDRAGLADECRQAREFDGNRPATSPATSGEPVPTE